MKAVDTNILARLILQDDAEQAAVARDALSRPVWIANTVWLELGWLLGRRLGLDRAAVCDSLSMLLTGATIHVADRVGLEWAIDRVRHGADWGDMMHLVMSRGAADAFLTFDRDIARRAGPDAPIRVETLS